MTALNIEEYTYANLMRLALSYVPRDMDKREGSIIYDALAPFCQVLAGMFLDLYNFNEQIYATTATGENLDLRVADIGIEREPATYAVKVMRCSKSDGNSFMTLTVGSRFSTISETNPLIYTVTERYNPSIGLYKVTCETAGTIGNDYNGALTPIDFIQDLADAYIAADFSLAQDAETDEELRKRYLDLLRNKAFSGNIADYKQEVNNIEGVGATQVYPVHNGGGTVEISIVDSTYSPCTAEFIAYVQNLLDPENVLGDAGTGLGIAPIGHVVTVVTPQEVTINITANVVLQSGITVQSITPAVTEAITLYLHNVRKSWGESDSLNVYNSTVYNSQIVYAILSVDGIISTSNVEINGSSDDLELLENSITQQIPKIGTVTLSV